MNARLTKVLLTLCATALLSANAFADTAHVKTTHRKARFHIHLKAANAVPTQVLPNGSDTGNGGDGGPLDFNHFPTDPTPFPRWCAAVQGWLDDIFRMLPMATNLSEARHYIVRSLTEILAAYDEGSLPMQPLTYSILSRAVAIDKVFPPSPGNAYALSDQVAVILLQHLMNVAKHVNADFDVPKLQPIYAYYSGCGQSCDEYDYTVFYADYISAARTVLNEFYSPAIPSQPTRGNLLEAMAHDRWELTALHEIIAWIISDLSRDMFNRNFDCAVTQLRRTERHLNDYLSGVQPPFQNDRSMRFYVEGSLGDILNTLNAYTYDDRYGGSCRAH